MLSPPHGAMSDRDLLMHALRDIAADLEREDQKTEPSGRRASGPIICSSKNSAIRLDTFCFAEGFAG